jgi:beta-glucanase (GH16 family)
VNSFSRTVSLLSLSAVGILGLAACQPAEAPTDTTAATTATTAAATPTTTTTAAAVTTTTAAIAPKGSWVYYGGDEFNDSALDRTKWKPYSNVYGYTNGQLECQTPNNVVEANGALTITSKKQSIKCATGEARNYTSGFVGSRETGTYYPKFARFEMRAKLNHAQGLWPAFWLRHYKGASTAEVDIMEYFHSATPGKTATTLHLDGVHNVAQANTAFEASSATPGWHTWAVEIEPVDAANPNKAVRFTFYLDDKQAMQYVQQNPGWATAAADDKTWDIALNQAVGGDWTGDPDGTLGYLAAINRCAQGGTPPSACKTTGINRVDWNDPSATAYTVDWVRVYTRK